MSDGDHLCRTCLGRDNLSLIFVRTDHSVRYTVALFLATGLKVEPDDGLPQLMCSACVGLVNIVIKFRNSSHRAEKALLTRGWRRTIDSDSSSISPPNNVYIKYDLTGTDEIVNWSEASENEISLEKKMSPENKIQSENNKINCKRLRVNGNHRCDKTNELKRVVDKSKRIRGRRRIEERTDVKETEKNNYKKLLVGSPGAEGPFQCNICKKTLKSLNSFKIHALTHFQFKFMCEHCGMMFPIESQLKRHCTWRHGARRRHVCSACGHRAVDAGELRIHTRKVHTGERPYVCDLCGADFFTRRSLSHHVAAHNPARDVQCKLCSATFKTIQHRNTHTTKVHRRRGKTFCKVACYLCEATYLTTSGARKHLERAHGVTRALQHDALRKIVKANAETQSV